MCSVQDDIEELSVSNCSNKITRIKKHISLELCRKCGEKSVLLLQKKDPLCRLCFLEYCNHKFRSTIGKSKKIKPGDKVLLSCSGGLKSTAMLHMVNEALESASHKRLIFIPVILHINEMAVEMASHGESTDDLTDLLVKLRLVKYPVLYTYIEMFHRSSSSSAFYWDAETCIPHVPPNSPLREKFIKCFSSIKSLSAKQDYLKHLRLRLVEDIAKHIGCTYIFLGDTATNLAVDLLSDVALGRGSQISSDTSFYDNRFEAPFCRPMRDFLNNEIAFYNHFHDHSYTVRPSLLTKTDLHSSIQRLTEKFVCNLQENFPATIFTIFRTGGKLSGFNSVLKENACIFCKSKLDNVNPDACSALEALCISTKLSKPVSRNMDLHNDSLHIGASSHATNDDVSSLVKDLESRNFKNFLCHGCSVTISQIENEKLLHSLVFEDLVAHNRQKMKEEIKSFLLVDEDL